MNKIKKILFTSVLFLSLPIVACGGSTSSSSQPSGSSQKPTSQSSATSSMASSAASSTVSSASSSVSSSLASSSSIVEKTLELIEVDPSSKTNYKVGQPFTKPKIMATYSDGSSENVSSACTYTGFDSITTGTKTINVSYTEKEVTKTTSYNIIVSEASTLIKYALFADVQLCNDRIVKVDGTVVANANFGNTANAPLALKNHLEFCKKEGIEYILMNGDVTNQANEYYYSYFESIVSSVYGNDKNGWPEFVWNMGNHEWWGGVTEQVSAESVTMFKSHARIESENLVATSNTTFEKKSTETLPSYYKVINGIPFMVVSGIDSSGAISSPLEEEIRTWLSEIKNLDSVKAGGPIFVEYHYPLSTSMTHGQGSSAQSAVIEDIFKDTPNAVIFTGDTHYPGNSERSINQVDFTNINIGSSSYSRMVRTSATEMCDHFDNLDLTGSKISDKLLGNAKFNEAYTPMIQIVEVDEDYSFTIDRYFSDEDGTAHTAGPRWEFPTIHSKSDFTYTNDRFESTESAQALYGKDGLNWQNEDEVVFGVNGTQMTVVFPDVIDYNCCEHYLINVNGVEYDEVSNYFKNPQTQGINYFILDNVAAATSYTVTVTAYDFYDNPSTNKLSSTTVDPTICIDSVDYASTKTYCDIQTRNRMDVFSDKKDTMGNDSQSSVEFYYKGIQTYGAGAILNRIYSKNDNEVSLKNYISLSNKENNNPTVRVDVKNPNEEDLVVGLSIVRWNGSKDDWKSDFGNDTQKTVAPGEWTTLEWDLTKWDINKKDELAAITLKAKTQGATSDGYDFRMFVDNIDIYDGEEGPRGQEFAAGYSKDLGNIPMTDTLTFDVSFTSAPTTFFNFMIGKGWKDYFGYYRINADGTLGDTYNGISVELLEDGYYRVSVKLSSLTKVGDGTKPTDYVNLFYIHGGADWSNATGYIQFVNVKPDPQTRGDKFTGGTDFIRDMAQISLTETFVIDVKFTSGASTHLNVMLGEGWNKYNGYFQINSDGTLKETYNGVTIQALEDGYYRVTFKLSELTKVEDMPKPTQYINLLYIRGSMTTGSGYIDINPTI